MAPRRWFTDFLSARFISIRDKFIVSVMAIIVILGGINFAISLRHTLQIARKSAQDKGELIGGILERELLQPILVRDMARLNGLINALREEDPEILYIVVFDEHGAILGHTFPATRIPAFIAEHASGRLSPVFLRDRERNLHIRQYTRLIHGGVHGRAMVGMDEGVLERKISRLVLIFWTVNISFYLLSALFIAFVSSLIIRPVKRLLSEFTHFVPGEAIEPHPPESNDEMKLLHDGFHEMVHRLNTMHAAHQRTQLQIIETEKMASIGILASGVAHEINNPVAGIEACAWRLRKNDGLGVKQREYVDLIVESVGHIKTVTRNLLQYARQPGQAEERIALVDVAEFSGKLLHYRFEKNRIALMTDYPTEPCYVLGTMVHLAQVVINGLLNALDVSAPGNVILVTIRGGDATVALDISDRGSGIDAKVVGKAFEPFVTTKGNKGTGLGLYVSYNIITALGGSLRLSDREDGAGAVLRVELPRAADAAQARVKRPSFGEGI